MWPEWKEILATYAREVSHLATELSNALAFADLQASRRDLQVVAAYWGIGGSRGQTLEAIGGQLGLTRERVRQLRDRTQERISEAIRRCEPPSVLLLKALVESHGGIVELATLTSEFQQLVSARSAAASGYINLLLTAHAMPELATVRPGLIANRSFSEPTVASLLDCLRAAIGVEGGALLDDLTNSVRDLLPRGSERSAEDVVRCLARHAGKEVLPGLYATRAWTRRHYAAFILEQNGEPMHFSVIAENMRDMTGRHIATSGLNSVLNSSPLFVRVGAGDFALAKWGQVRYGRFDEVIERYLASGRVAEHVDTISRALLREYTVAPSTVRAMLSTNKVTFIHYGGGYWGLRGYKPIIDEELLRRVQAALSRSAGPLDVGAVCAMLPEQSGSPAPERSEVARALYTSVRFERVGGPQNQRFSSSHTRMVALHS